MFFNSRERFPDKLLRRDLTCSAISLEALGDYRKYRVWLPLTLVYE